MAFDARYERRFVCGGCGATNIVGGHWDDLDPDTYRGYVCGCRPEKQLEASGLAARIAQARQAQKAQQ